LPVPDTVAVHCEVCPTCTEVGLQDAETEVMVDEGPIPIPLKLTDWGLPPPSSLINSDAVLVPAAEGANPTVITQLLPAARVLPQVLLLEKSAAPGPSKTICQMFIGLLPKLLSVTV
jgi:hypothetical protein